VVVTGDLHSNFKQPKAQQIVFSRRESARVLPVRLAFRKTEGAGNAGCTIAPAASRVENKARELVTTGTPKQSGIPRAMVYGL
jgi:hypothetical protein